MKMTSGTVKMILFADDINQIYYWTDQNNVLLSPHFDYEEDAIEWKKKTELESKKDEHSNS